MSQSVERLKQLLFENETLALADLSERIARLSASEALAREELARRLEGLAESDAQSATELRTRIAALAEASERARDDFRRQADSIAEIDAKARAELSDRLERLHDRTGDDERLTESVAQIIGEALRRAEISDHVELSHNIAPLVVTTIKTELRNSQDEMVEALYPITGRLVKAYVASAIKDLSEQMNRRLEQNPVMLRLQSLTTGRPVAELALAGTHDFEIKELYLIRRGSGELVAHWPDKPISGREHVMSGVLAAVNEFANEALSAEQSSLREIDLGGEQVYLRGSPIYLLAARCSGQAPRPIAQALDDAFLSAVERQHSIDTGPQMGQDTSEARAAALAEVGEELSATVSDTLGSVGGSGSLWPLKLLAALIFVPLLGWFGWTLYNDYLVSQVRTKAERVIAAEPDMTGYPVQISVAGYGTDLTVMGLAPSREARSRVIRNLKETLPDVALHERISLVAGSGIEIPDIEPEISRIRDDLKIAIAGVTRGTWQRSNARAATRLDQAVADLARAAPAITEEATRSDVSRIASGIGDVQTRFAALVDTTRTAASMDAVNDSIPAYRQLSERLAELSGGLLAIVGVPPSETAQEAEGEAGDATIDDAIERFAGASDRIASLAATVAAAKSLRPPQIVKEVVAPAEPTPREVLRNWTRDHAIFFSESVDYRDPEAADRSLAALADIMKQKPGALRIVGYTDETGAQDQNERLAKDRATKVLDELVSRGVDPQDLIVVGRSQGLDLSDDSGATSPNRRVQFELAFEGEPTR